MTRSEELKQQLADLDRQMEKLGVKRLDPMPPVNRNDPAQVQNLQNFLAQKGLYRGNIDGRWGSGTASAVADYGSQLSANQQDIDNAAKRPEVGQLLLLRAQLTGKLADAQREEEQNTTGAQLKSGAVNFAAPATGYGLGIWKASSGEKALKAKEDAMRSAAKNLGERNAAINPESGSALAQYKAIGDEARAAGYMRSGRPLSTFGPAALLLGAGALTRGIVEPYVRERQGESAGDVAAGLGNIEYGSGAGMATMQGLYNAYSKPVVDAADRQGFRAAQMMGKAYRSGNAGPAPGPAVPGRPDTTPPIGPEPPEPGPRGPVGGPAITGQPKEALKDMAKHLGITIDPKANKEEVASAVTDAFNNADTPTARSLAARFNEIGPDAAHSLPEAAVRKNVGNIIGRLASNRTTLTGIAGLGALLGATSTSDEAQAGPSVLNEGPEPSAIEKAMAVAKGVASVAPYTWGPVALQGMMEATPEVPAGPKTAVPEDRAKAIYERAQADRNLSAAQAEDARHFREMKARKSLTSTDYRGIPGEEGTTPPPALSKVFPHSAKFAPASDENARQLLEDARTVQDQEPEQHLAKGGAVEPKKGSVAHLPTPTLKKLSKTLSYLTDEVHRFAPKIAKLESAYAKTGNEFAKRLLDKTIAERLQVIDDLWSVHYLARHINQGGEDTVRPLTRSEIISHAGERKLG
ncbi:MAG: peptidoglycan-binding domain-containing protein [Rhodomicrobium sp.]